MHTFPREPSRSEEPLARDLAAFELFAGLPLSRLETLAAASSRRRFSRGECIYAIGAPAAELYFIERGKVRLSLVSSTGRTLTIGICSPGQHFGELFLSNRRRDEQAEALTDGQAIVVPRAPLEVLLAAEARLGINLAQALSAKLDGALRQLDLLSFSSASERIGRLLATLAREHGIGEGAVVEIDLDLTHQDIAAMLGVSRESVTIVLNRLKAAGAVAYRGDHLVVDRDHLMAAVLRPRGARAGDGRPGDNREATFGR
ncbi:MAG TPA: Crp/Fnr family transcriptional regulator [Thermodesulfobacteriota bacterium]|nr:Crp/Fnr family transcriptional regulator [Thermodesulfobacteriota bacterium]